MILVKAYWATEADGSPVPDDVDLEDGPISYYGPFASLYDAISWMENDYPQDDTDVREMIADDFGPDEVDPEYINAPDSIYGDHPDEDIRPEDPREIHIL